MSKENNQPKANNKIENLDFSDMLKMDFSGLLKSANETSAAKEWSSNNSMPHQEEVEEPKPHGGLKNRALNAKGQPSV